MKLSVLASLAAAVTAAVLHHDARATTADSITIHATHGPAITAAVESEKFVVDASSSAAMSSPSADQTDEHFYISPAMPSPPAMMKRDDLEAANVNKDVNCHSHADCEGGSCLGGICIAEPPTAKRDVAKDVNCYGDIDCDGGSCFNNICIAEPNTKKRDGPGWGDIGGTCAVDKDCGPGNSCLAGVCVDKPSAKPPVQKRDGPGWGDIGGTCAGDEDCGPGNSCLAGVCVDKPPAEVPTFPRCDKESDCRKGPCMDGHCTQD